MAVLRGGELRQQRRTAGLSHLAPVELRQVIVSKLGPTASVRSTKPTVPFTAWSAITLGSAGVSAQVEGSGP